MINLKCRFNDKQVSEFSRAISGVKDAMQDFTPLWEAMVPPISAAISENFAKQGNYYEGWKSLSKKYLTWKVKHGLSTRILEATGNMRRGATVRNDVNNICAITRSSFAWGVNDSAVPYAIYHDSDRPRKRLPRREFMTLDETAVYDIINRAIGDFVRSAGLPSGVYRRG